MVMIGGGGVIMAMAVMVTTTRDRALILFRALWRRPIHYSSNMTPRVDALAFLDLPGMNPK